MFPIRSLVPNLARPVARSERRAYPRHKPGKRLTCLIWRTPDDTPGRAVVQDVSARGLALIVRDWFEQGEVISVRLFNESLTFCLDVKLRVIRRCTLPDGDYFVGGELDRELEPAELLPFVV